MVSKEMSVTPRRGLRSRLPLLFGLAAPGIVAAGILIASFRNRAVNPLHQSISLLMDGPGRDLLEASLLVAGSCVLWTAWAIFRGVSHGVFLALFQGLLGFGVMASGAFMQHHLPPAHQWAVPSPWGALTPIGLIHVAAAAVLYTALVGTCWAVGHCAQVQAITRIAHGTGLGLIVLLVLFVFTAVVHGPSGLFERLVAAVGIGWEYGLMFIVWHWVS
jgi:hypothetical protein